MFTTFGLVVFITELASVRGSAAVVTTPAYFFCILASYVIKTMTAPAESANPSTPLALLKP